MYIRDKSEERTSIQTHGALNPTIDCQCDVVMLYGLNEELPERLKTFRDAGYRLHFMTGIAWGGYVDYLYGDWDGRDHWDEAQTDRWGNR
ncbi:MAG: hypothetical protein II738_03875, partial [Clostridia bacterium]|nr:hypothetical protein [Clostridia bacterium]